MWAENRGQGRKYLMCVDGCTSTRFRTCTRAVYHRLDNECKRGWGEATFLGECRKKYETSKLDVVYIREQRIRETM